ncbi:MAG: hypothetical protein SFV51_14785 [Bryobacteraceae bacterium]|nr:hypothetical protein [Bryobacteraceae bacterium]
MFIMPLPTRCQQIVYEEMPAHGLTLLTPKSADFQEAVKQLSGGDVAGLSRVLPYSVIIKNQSQKAVLAVALRYGFFNPDHKPIAHVIRHLPQAGRVLIPSGGAFFASPIARLNTAVKHGRVTEVDRVELEKAIRVEVRPLESQSVVTFALDSILFSDNMLVGMDKSGMLNHLRGCSRAEEELKGQIRSLTGAQLRDYLERLSEDRVAFKAEMSEVENYQLHLKTTARALIALLNHQGEARLKQVALSPPTRCGIQFASVSRLSARRAGGTAEPRASLTVKDPRVTCRAVALERAATGTTSRQGITCFGLGAQSVPPDSYRVADSEPSAYLSMQRPSRAEAGLSAVERLRTAMAIGWCKRSTKPASWEARTPSRSSAAGATQH